MYIITLKIQLKTNCATYVDIPFLILNSSCQLIKHWWIFKNRKKSHHFNFAETLGIMSTVFERFLFSCESICILSSRLNISTVIFGTEKGCIFCANVYYIWQNMVILYLITIQSLSWNSQWNYFVMHREIVYFRKILYRWYKIKSICYFLLMKYVVCLPVMIWMFQMKRQYFML